MARISDRCGIGGYRWRGSVVAVTGLRVSVPGTLGTSGSGSGLIVRSRNPRGREDDLGIEVEVLGVLVR